VTFRADLLGGRRVAAAGGAAGGGVAAGGAAAGGVAVLILQRLRALGAWVESVDGEVLLDEDAAAAWMRARAPLDALVFDGGESFGEGGPERLRTALEVAWRAARAAATGALIEAESPGRLLFIAPAPAAGPYAEAARAGLENLARTLSVEWARFAITAVAVTPGVATTEAELAELVCFLVSPAGGYFSGCRFDLGAVSPPPSASAPPLPRI
jgi:NAD(P)-dependent dehydrogenase (short-subunit alcohol dehydrogenase family)